MARNAANHQSKARKAKTAVSAERATISHYIVTKDGRPCALFNVLETQRAGILLPSISAETFEKRRNANAAIARTELAAAQLRGSMLCDWLNKTHDQARELMSAGAFVVLPIRAK